MDRVILFNLKSFALSSGAVGDDVQVYFSISLSRADRALRQQI